MWSDSEGEPTPPQTPPSIMIQKFNPYTGKYGWEPNDETYDYHQEIARSAFADMLHDSERNEKYYEAIRAAIEQTHREGRQAHVLDIGTGTGLLAMMAARCGADTIHACEAFLPISKCAEEVIKDNKLADKIKVIHKRSTDVTVGESGDLPRRCNILVTEVFDTELIGEGAIGTFNHAHAHLLEKDCLVVPTRGTVYAQVVESDWMQRWNQLMPWDDVAPSESIRRCPGAAAVHDLQLSQLRQDDFRAITSPVPVFRFDWTCHDQLIPLNETNTVSVEALTSGTAQMVFMWWSLDMDPQGKIELSCAPWWAHPSKPPGPDHIPWRDHWMQAVYYLPPASVATVQQNQPIRLHASHDEFSMWFNLSTNDNDSSDVKQAERPVCECMMHVTCSRTRIGMLNDPTRREKYAKVLRPLVTPDSVVMSFGNLSLLGLYAATLGAKKVFHLEEPNQSLQVFGGLVSNNNLGSKVTILKSSTPPILDPKERILLVAEPYITSGLLPWHINSWWEAKKMTDQKFENSSVMPLAASLMAMAVQFDHLHKIRSPLGTISGFKMAAFDRLIQKSSSVSDSNVEAHPLWEYPSVCLTEPKKIHTLGPVGNFISAGNMPFDVPGTCNGVVLWVDIHLDEETTVSTGPVEPPAPGKRVQWDPYTRQAVYFIQPQEAITQENFLTYRAEFNVSASDIQFTFDVGNFNKIKLPKKEI